jgi:hypothetical protein
MEIDMKTDPLYRKVASRVLAYSINTNSKNDDYTTLTCALSKLYQKILRDPDWMADVLDGVLIVQAASNHAFLNSI